MTFYVYVLFNKEHSKIYIGQTQDVVERLRIHNERIFKKSYTAAFSGFWELIYREEFENRKEALRREKQLKSFQGRRFLKENIIPAWRNGSADAC